MRSIIKSRYLWISLVIVCVHTLLFLYLSGFCFRKMRYLTKTEITIIAQRNFTEQYANAVKECLGREGFVRCKKKRWWDLKFLSFERIHYGNPIIFTFWRYKDTNEEKEFFGDPKTLEITPCGSVQNLK